MILGDSGDGLKNNHNSGDGLKNDSGDGLKNDSGDGLKNNHKNVKKCQILTHDLTCKMLKLGI